MNLHGSQTCTLAMRPEAITLATQPGSQRNTVQAVVDEVSFLGSIVRIRCHVGPEVLSPDLFNNPSQPLPELCTNNCIYPIF
ncbi:MAG: TOBE domain-containing protein [Rhodoferax sp.]|nr:TOBE domain-containing protein [Rhodoferax sp.]